MIIYTSVEIPYIYIKKKKVNKIYNKTGITIRPFFFFIFFSWNLGSLMLFMGFQGYYYYHFLSSQAAVTSVRQETRIMRQECQFLQVHSHTWATVEEEEQELGGGGGGGGGGRRRGRGRVGEAERDV